MKLPTTILLAALATMTLGCTHGTAGSDPAGAKAQISPVPEECLFSTPEAQDKMERDDPSLYGLSPASIALNTEYQLDIRKPRPAGSVIWSHMAMTREDSERLLTISQVRRDNIAALQTAARRIAGKEFVGVTWSYVDGFVVSVTEKSDFADELTAALPGVPIRVNQGLVRDGVATANLKVLSELGHDGFIAASDASCGVTFVAFSQESLSEERLDEVLVPGTYRVVGLDFFGGSMPQAAVNN